MIGLLTVGSSWITESFIKDALSTNAYNYLGHYSRNPESAQKFSEKYGVMGYTHFEAAAESQAQVVYIASPNSKHYEQIMFFLKSGKSVICEKPLVLNTQQFSDVYELADQKGLYVFEALRHLHTPGFKFIKDNLHLVGKVRNVVLSFNQYSSKYPAFLNGSFPNVFNKGFGGGALRDLGVYPISFAVALFGRPSSYVHSMVKATNGVDLVVGLILNYDSFLVNITVSKVSDGSVESHIMGEDGVINLGFVQELDRITYKSRQDHNNVNIFSDQDVGKLYHEAEAFAQIINSRNCETYQKLREISLMCVEIHSKI